MFYLLPFFARIFKTKFSLSPWHWRRERKRVRISCKILEQDCNMWNFQCNAFVSPFQVNKRDESLLHHIKIVTVFFMLVPTEKLKCTHFRLDANTHLKFIFRWIFSKIKCIWMPMSIHILSNVVHVLVSMRPNEYDFRFLFSKRKYYQKNEEKRQRDAQQYANIWFVPNEWIKRKENTTLEQINLKMSIPQIAFALSFAFVWPSHVQSTRKYKITNWNRRSKGKGKEELRINGKREGEKKEEIRFGSSRGNA